MAHWWALKILNGERAGEIFTLNPEKTVIGRTKGDLVVRKDAEMSGQHVELTFEPQTNAFALVDLGSRNGTRVNGTFVRVHQLKAGDAIRIGTTDFLLLAPEANSAPIVTTPAATTTEPPRSEKPQTDGYGNTFSRIFLRPDEFFRLVGTEQNTLHAIRFAATNWMLGWIMALSLTTLLALLLKMSYDIKSVMALVVAGLSSLLLIPFFVPISAILLHATSRVFNGRAPFRKAIQISCYATAFIVSASVLDLVPGAGKYLGFAPLAYSAYVLALAAIHVYGVQRKRAFIAWGTAGATALCAIAALQEHGAQIKNAFFAAQINANPAEIVFVMKATYHDAIKEAVGGRSEQRVPAGN